MSDWRNIENGLEIPTRNYCDQPFVVVADDGAWLCVVTTGNGYEGEPGQHVIAMRSTDKGATWSEAVPLEPISGPEASYAVLLKANNGRIYAFYNHNSGDVRRVQADRDTFPDGYTTRVDSLGHYVFRYSDDHGRTWSSERYDVPQRLMAIDRENADGGRLLYFWNVGKPFVHDGKAYVPLHKVGGFGKGFFTRTEGVLLCSDNILDEADPARIQWETLPEGDLGLRTPPGGGPIAEEQSFVVLSDGSFFAVYRSIDGHPVCSYSRNAGRNWETPRYLCYPDGRRLKHPRAANFIWRCSNGKYLYWFHHNGTRDYNHGENAGNRNPAWLCGAVEVNTSRGRELQFSQPDVVLYDPDFRSGISYPDLVEFDGNFYLTETQKSTARVHQIESALLEGLWAQFDDVRPSGPEANWIYQRLSGSSSLNWPGKPIFDRSSAHTGFSIELLLDGIIREGLLLDNRSSEGRGVVLKVVDGPRLELVLCDYQNHCRWQTDRIAEQSATHVIVNVDAAANLISGVINGQLCDGDERPFGWHRIPASLIGVQGGEQLKIASVVSSLQIYNRSLTTGESVALYRRLTKR